MSLESASMAPNATPLNQPLVHSMKLKSASADTHAAQPPRGTMEYQPWRPLNKCESDEIALLIQRVDADFGQPSPSVSPGQ